jgi:glutamine amidotransferase
MQLLFGSSEESPGAEGLGFIEGSVRRLDASRAKVPHMGWGRLRFTRGDPGAPGLEWAYFVHSFAADPADAGCVNCWADHGAPFPAVVSSGGVLGVQFHPEKSQAPGVRYLGSLLGGEP